MKDGPTDSSSALRNMHDLELASLVESFEAARRADPSSVTVESWCAQHPAFAEELAELLPGLLLMESVATETSEAAAQRASLEPLPESIGEYRIKKRLGRGGMGIVYLAEQASLGREVALKVLPTNVDLDRGFLERFRREAQAAARLLHANIVPVFGAGQADGRHFFAMRYIEGASLDEKLRELRSQTDGSSETYGEASSAFPLRQAVEIVRGVASAVAHAHSKGILHRDIKPGNVLLDGEGRSWVTDFGLCRIEDAGQLTSDGAILGTLRYMAPEQIEGVADERSDVYGVGLLLFELLVMGPAFDSVKRAKVVHDVLHTPVPRLRRLRSSVPRSLETIVQKATNKLPEERYQSAEALERDLEAFLEDRPISARPPSALYLARLFASRHRLATAVAMVALLLLALLGALYVRDLRASRSLSERRAYVGDLAAAEAALREGATQRARFHLDQAPPSLRAWEWAHLDARIDQSLGAVQVDSAILEDLAIDSSATRVAVASGNRVSIISLPDLVILAQIRCAAPKRVCWDASGRQLFVAMYGGEVQHYALSATGTEEGYESAEAAEEWALVSTAEIPSSRRREPKSIVMHGEDVVIGGRYGSVIRWSPTTGAVVLVDILGGDVVSVGTTYPAATHPSAGASAAAALADEGLADEEPADEEPVYWVATGAGEVAIYRGTERVRMFRVDHRQTEVRDVVLDPDLMGGVLATRAGALLAFDARGGEVIELFSGPSSIRKLARAGRRVALVGDDKVLHIVDRERRDEVMALSGNAHPVNDVAFVPGSRMILTVAEDGWLRVFDRGVSGGGMALHGHVNDVNALSFSADGRRLVTGSRGGVVIVWDAQKAAPIEVFTEPRMPISAVGFYSDGGSETLFASSTEGRVYCWTRRESAPVNSRDSGDEPEERLGAGLPDADETKRGEGDSIERTLEEFRLQAVARDGDLDPSTGRIFFATTRGIECLNLQTRAWDSPRADGAQLCAGLNFVSLTIYDGRVFAMTLSGELFVIDPRSGETLLRKKTGIECAGSRLSLTGTGDSVQGAFVSRLRDVVIFDGQTGETEVLFSSRTADGFLGEYAMEVLWIEDGARLLVTTRNGLVSVWDPVGAEHLLDLRGHPHWAMRITRCAATGWIASLSSYGGVRLWNTISSSDWAELASAAPPLVDEASARAAISSIERRELMGRFADRLESSDHRSSLADERLIGSMYRTNDADTETATVYALTRARADRSAETVALLESAAARLPVDHTFRPFVEEALEELWDVVAWRDGRRGETLSGSSGQKQQEPRTQGRTVLGVAAASLPVFLVGALGALAPVGKELLWLLRSK